MKMSPEPNERCPLCGEPLQDNLQACTNCDWVPNYGKRPKFRANPRSIAAVLMSVVPGLGHVFKGHKRIGFLLMFLGIPLVVGLTLALNVYLGWAVLPIFWAAVAFDAYVRKDVVFPASTPATKTASPR